MLAIGWSRRFLPSDGSAGRARSRSWPPTAVAATLRRSRSTRQSTSPAG